VNFHYDRESFIFICPVGKGGNMEEKSKVKRDGRRLGTRMKKDGKRLETRMKYIKPVLTKHKKLRDITSQTTGTGIFLGCTKSFI
jgi:hypothetical protein